jgi:hypothetical protein
MWRSNDRAIRRCAHCEQKTEHVYSQVDARRFNWLCLAHQAPWLAPTLDPTAADDPFRGFDNDYSVKKEAT